jgi:hypothetical protein
MALEVLELLALADVAAFVIPVCLLAFVLWQAGVHDPFLISAFSLVPGVIIGFIVERSLNRRTRRRGDKRPAVFRRCTGREPARRCIPRAILFRVAGSRR